MPDLTLADAQLHYEITGAGKPLLLLAGLASDSASWGPLPPLLPGDQLIMPDNRGSGRTISHGALTLGQMVDDLVALLDHLGIARLPVVGHSMGGYLALMLADRAPERVSRVVTLTSGNPAPSRRQALADLAEIRGQVAEETWFRLLFQHLFSEPFFADPATIAAAAAASAAYPFKQSAEDFRRQFAAAIPDLDRSRIAAPVLAVIGGADSLSPEAAVRALHEGISDLTYSTIPAAAHSIHWEAPAAVAAAITAFLAEG